MCYEFYTVLEFASCLSNELKIGLVLRHIENGMHLCSGNNLHKVVFPKFGKTLLHSLLEQSKMGMLFNSSIVL